MKYSESIFTKFWMTFFVFVKLKYIIFWLWYIRVLTHSHHNSLLSSYDLWGFTPHPHTHTKYEKIVTKIWSSLSSFSSNRIQPHHSNNNPIFFESRHCLRQLLLRITQPLPRLGPNHVQRCICTRPVNFRAQIFILL